MDSSLKTKEAITDTTKVQPTKADKTTTESSLTDTDTVTLFAGKVKTFSHRILRNYDEHFFTLTTVSG